MLNKKFRSHHDETILSLQYCKWNTEDHETDEEWIGQLRVTANDCKYIFTFCNTYELCHDKIKKINKNTICNYLNLYRCQLLQCENKLYL